VHQALRQPLLILVIKVTGEPVSQQHYQQTQSVFEVDHENSFR
jgi:hypothetical protein